MTHADIVNAMRFESASIPTDAINRLIELSGGYIDQFEMIKIFKEAFPNIPLRILTEASSSRIIIGDGGVDDDELNRLMGPWFKSVDAGPR